MRVDWAAVRGWGMSTSLSTTLAASWAKTCRRSCRRQGQGAGQGHPATTAPNTPCPVHSPGSGHRPQWLPEWPAAAAGQC